MSIIGYLAPDGTFTKCTSWGHSSCAASICKKLGVTLCGYMAEVHLLNVGYVCFRSRDAYMKHYKDKEYCNADSNYNFLTDQQIAFIEKHQRDWNNIDQANCINDMVKYSEDLKEDLS